jgi:hypothetical protein
MYARISQLLRRFCLTFAIAFVLACLLAVLKQEVGDFAFLPLWIALFLGWPYLSRRWALYFPKSQQPRPPAPKRPFAIRLLRGFGKLVSALILVLIVPQLPLGFSFYQAESARRTLHVGMTEDEVLRSVRGWDGMQVLSFPEGADPDTGDILAISFGTSGNGVYTVGDYTTGRGRQISEPEALALIQQKVQGTDKHSFLYNYVNFNQKVYFSVVFGPDGRVTEVREIETRFPA